MKNILILIVGILLVLNGFANIVDDSRVLTYDITSILSGLGFVLVSRKYQKQGNDVLDG
jgi:hypothetical protein